MSKVKAKAKAKVVKAVKKVRVLKAKEDKKHVGAKRLLTDKQHAQLVKMFKSGKHKAKELCEKFGLSAPTFYNYLNRDLD